MTMRKTEATIKTPRPLGMTLRLELFVDDIAVSQKFYMRVLRFTCGEPGANDYTPMRNGEVVLALNLRSSLPDTHPLKIRSHERPGRGMEIVLEVEDIDALYAHVRFQGWPIVHPLQLQAWGLRDFRIVDPDGYYLRLTSRRH